MKSWIDPRVVMWPPNQAGEAMNKTGWAPGFDWLNLAQEWRRRSWNSAHLRTPFLRKQESGTRTAK